MADEELTFRALTIEDEPFLWEMLYQAIFIPPGCAPFPREIVRQPEISQYVAGWGRPGDRGFLACVGDEMIGAAWVRLFRSDDAGYGFIDDETPELTIAVTPEWRGRGIGTSLLMRLLTDAQHYYRAVSLSVSADNPARRLYQRMGFATMRADGASLTMVRHLQQPNKL